MLSTRSINIRAYEARKPVAQHTQCFAHLRFDGFD